MTSTWPIMEKAATTRQGCCAPRHRRRGTIGADLVWHFQTGDKKIFYSLAACRWATQRVEYIVEVRGDAPFTSIEDFCLRIDPKQVTAAYRKAFVCRRPIALHRSRPAVISVRSG